MKKFIPKVSIIVPVYNTQDYLEQALDSLLSQSFSELEIVCVDDGSTDNSPSILDKYADANNNFIVIHKKNEGAAKARKIGVSAASADVIGFLDSDDWIEPDMIKELYEKMRLDGVDMISSGNIRNEAGDVFADGIAEGIYRKSENWDKVMENLIMDKGVRTLKIGTSASNKLFKKEILQKAMAGIDDRIRFHDDDCLVYSYLMNCHSFTVTHKVYYHYRLNETSMTHTHDEYYFARMNLVYLFLKECFLKTAYSDILIPQLEQYFVDAMMDGINHTYSLSSIAHVEWTFPYENMKNIHKIVIYGAGICGKRVINNLLQKPEKEIVAILDQDSTLKEICGIKVLRPEEIKNMQYEKIIIAIKNEEIVSEVKNLLLSYGVKENRIVKICV